MFSFHASQIGFAADELDSPSPREPVGGPIGAPEHDAAVEWLTERFVTELAGRASVRVRSAPTFPGLDSEPEPELVVVARDAPRPRHPSAALLVVEVAVSSLIYDRRVKATPYARAGVPEDWIVDLAGEAVERFGSPVAAGYADTQRLTAGATLVPKALGARR